MTRPSAVRARVLVLATLAAPPLLAARALGQTPAPTEPAAPPAAAPGGSGPSTPSTTTDQELEEELFGKGGPPAPTAAPPPAGQPAARPPAAPPPRHAKIKMVQAPEPAAGEETAGDERAAFALELQTAGFASGELGGGLFLGARFGGDLRNLIVGGSLDIATASASTTVGTTTNSMSSTAFTLGGGARYTMASDSDGRVDLFGAGDVGFVYTSLGTTMGTTSTSQSASGFTLAVGPGLRVWIFDHLALGYVARFRLTKVSGSSGGADATTTGFAGAFQLLGVF